MCIAYSEVETMIWRTASNDEVRESIALGPVHLSRALRVFKYMRQKRIHAVVAPGGRPHAVVREPLRDAMRRSGRLSIRQACARDLCGRCCD